MRMSNKLLDFVFNDVRLSLEIAKEGTVSLFYVGKNKEKINKNKGIYRPLVEIDVANDNRQDRAGFKSVRSNYGLTNKYVRHYVNTNNKGQEVVIVTSNDYLEVETHFQFYNGVSGLSSFNIVKNITKEDVTLTYVSSFVGVGFYNTNSKDLYLYHSTNSWHCEAQWVKDSFLHLGIFNGNENCSNKRYLINNTGSWSTKDHLPMMVIEDKKNKEKLA